MSESVTSSGDARSLIYMIHYDRGGRNISFRTSNKDHLIGGDFFSLLGVLSQGIVDLEDENVALCFFSP
jgi:hypothetical protein